MPVKTDEKIYAERIKKLSASISYRVRQFSKTYSKEATATNKTQLKWLAEELNLLNGTYQLYYNSKNK